MAEIENGKARGGRGKRDVFFKTSLTGRKRCREKLLQKSQHFPLLASKSKCGVTNSFMTTTFPDPSI